MSDNVNDCTKQGDMKYFAFVGVLMVVIIGLLAVLCVHDRTRWVHERTRRIAAERDAIRLQQQLEMFQGVLGPRFSEADEDQPATAPSK